MRRRPSQAGLMTLPSVARLSGLRLTRGFASPPHGGFAFFGKGSSLMNLVGRDCDLGARGGATVKFGQNRTFRRSGVREEVGILAWVFVFGTLPRCRRPLRRRDGRMGSCGPSSVLPGRQRARE